MLYINKVYTCYMVCVKCVYQFSNWCQRAASEKAKGLILHLKGPRLPKWFLEAALKLKIDHLDITHGSLIVLLNNSL